MKIAVIGSNRGIGLEFVKQLSESNEVHAFCRTSSEKLKNCKNTTIYTDFDTTKTKDMEKKINETLSDDFDQVIVVSGILESDSLKDWSDDSLIKQFAVNSLGALNCARLFSKKLKSNGKIGVLSSRMGSIQDNESGGMYGYRMSKAALNAGCKSLALDLKAENKTLLILHPGYVKTDMTNNNGNIETDEAVKGLVRIMNEKNMSKTGTFWHTNGEALPW